MKFLVFSALALILAKPCEAGLKVAIDPGHGGFDRGAVHGKVFESDIALKISQLVHKRLQQDPQFQPFLLRNSDIDLKLPTRVKKSEKRGADLFVSIHVNSNPNPDFHGIEFYIQNQMPIEEESLFLANRENSAHHHEGATEDTRKLPQGNIESILYDLKKSQRILESYDLSWHMKKQWTQKHSRLAKSRIRQGPFYVLSQNHVPAVLVEVGYLSHPRERKKLLSPTYQNQLALRIYRGLVSYRKNMDKSPSPALKL